MTHPAGSTINIGGNDFEVIKSARLREGMVVRRGNVYGRVGPKQFVLDEQVHTAALFRRGFPVPEVLGGGELPDGRRYFLESSMGEETFHHRFVREYRAYGRVTDETFQEYLSVVRKYFRAQTDDKNRSHASAEDFIREMIPDSHVLPNFTYFGHDEKPYLQAIDEAGKKLADAPMGILQYDLNPYNMLEKGVIDFELVGYGPIGYDVLMSARWGGTWFTDYPSRYPLGYKLDDTQLAKNDSLVREIAQERNLPDPGQYMQEFLLLKSAWAASEFVPPQPDWPQDKLAFRRFRSNVLKHAVENYLAGEPIVSQSFPGIPGGEL